MGSINHSLFVSRHRALFVGPVLEVGARDYGSTQNLRELFPGDAYLGVDLSAGNGVDLVADLTQAFDDLPRPLREHRFGTVFCLSVLEHCARPFRMADNLVRLLAPGGRLYVSVPFAWKYHGYPADYWRFTAQGVRQLFPGLDFDERLCRATSPRRGDFEPISDGTGLLPLSGKHHRQAGHPGLGLLADGLKWLGKLPGFHHFFGFRYLLRPTMLEMVGQKPLPEAGE